ncbi:MAG: hypothetical protein IAE79_01915 [Anaerolinea sp.]|nr:hypothetical protein [Anaerolinea sp.]
MLFVVLLISGCREPTPPLVTAVPRTALSSIVEPLPTAQPIQSIADLSHIPDDDPLMVSPPQGEVVDGIAYITRNRDLWLIDVQNRERPFVLTHIALPTKASDLAVADNRLFLALYAPYSMWGDRIRSSGVVQFDITNPTNLVEVGFFHAPEMTGSLSVVGNELYVYEHHHRDPLGRQSGFHHVNSANMMPLSFTSALFHNDNWQFIQNQDWLYTLVTRYQKEITWNNIKIHIYNAAAEEVNEVLVANKYSQRSFLSFSALLEGETLYLLGVGLNESDVLETRLIVFDVSQPMEPVQVNDVSFKDWEDVGGQYLAVEGNILVVAAIDTLWLLDIRHREEPKLTAVYQTGASSYIGDMGFDNDQLYLVREDGLQFYRLDGFQLTESVFVPLPSE